MKERLSKRTQGYKRRIEALSRKPDAVVALLDRAIQAGFSADFVLMDSWFTQAPLLRELMAKGLHVIGMVKAMKQRYRLDGKSLTLHELYALLPKQKTKKFLAQSSFKPPAVYRSNWSLCKTAIGGGIGWFCSALIWRWKMPRSFAFTACVGASRPSSNLPNRI